MSTNLSLEHSDFQDKRSALLPTLGFCGLFFTFYYLFLIIPRFGISEIFFIDNVGGSFIVAGFLAAHTLTRRFSHEALLLLP